MLARMPPRQRVDELKALVEQLKRNLEELARIREVNKDLLALLVSPFGNVRKRRSN